MKKPLFALSLLTASALTGVAADVAFPDADSSHDIGSAAAWGSTELQTGDTATFAGGVTYKLTADKALPGPMKVTGSGKTVFDFSADSKTLSVTGGLTDSIGNRETVMKGGTWTFTGGGLSGFLYKNGGSLLLDGVNITATTQPYFRNAGTLASNASCVLTNATKMTLTADSYLFGSSGGNWSTNNELLVTGGSEINLGGKHFYIGGSYGAFTRGRMFDNRLVVRGAGSKVYTGGKTSINLGYQSDDSTIIVEDGGWMFSYNMNIGQSGGNSPSSGNTLIVRNGGICTNVQGSAIGYAANANSNRVYVLNNGQLNVGKAGTYAQLNIGLSNSSYNSLTLSNGTVSARWVDVGHGASSHDNRFEISGNASKFGLTDGGPWRLFGSGYDNEVVIDNGADFTFGQCNLVTAPDSLAHGSSNTLAVRNGSIFRVNDSRTLTIGDGTADAGDMKLEVSGGSQYIGKGSITLCSVGGAIDVSGDSQLTAGTLNVGNDTRAFTGSKIRVTGSDSSMSINELQFKASESELIVDDGAELQIATRSYIGSVDSDSSANTLFVGNGATLKPSTATGNQINLFSDNSAIVISNGTIQMSSGYGKFRMGVNLKDDNTFISAEGTNTMLVFKGDHPLLTAGDDTLQMHIGGSYSWGDASNVTATIRYELPPNGYTEAPVQKCMQVWASKHLNIELAGLEECRRTLTETTTFPLWDCSYSFADEGFNQAVIRLNKKLAAEGFAGCYAEIVQPTEGSVKARLQLTVKPRRGFIIMVGSL